MNLLLLVKKWARFWQFRTNFGDLYPIFKPKFLTNLIHFWPFLANFGQCGQTPANFGLFGQNLTKLQPILVQFFAGDANGRYITMTSQMIQSNRY